MTKRQAERALPGFEGGRGACVGAPDARGHLPAPPAARGGGGERGQVELLRLRW